MATPHDRMTEAIYTARQRQLLPTISAACTMIEIRRHQHEWILTTEQILPTSLPAAFDFFSHAGNLEAITPAWLNFRILTPEPIHMRQGTLIEYRIRLHGIPIHWRTEITSWNPPYSFVDTQLSGPYRKWIHTHTFDPHPDGVLARDHVVYDVWGGRAVNFLVVQRDLRKIFEFREQQLRAHFSGMKNDPAGETP
ncbi:SRPBCC family protein [Planctomicrobium sp. SH661]|uniref:SRPBCC family protein n=1 Tax=Planctomicrobium sp. SH661 TaxID=3448124 RepID=UPI003F5BB1F3